ncbi:MAG: creatininase family protein [Ruminococcaceae bacterium]|nr:creatininase family protein [Oscillospiraceae bacterium]
MLWEELREEEFEEAIKKSRGLCVLPLGCLEKHGQHLPVGTDYFEAMDAVKEAAEIEDAVIFPTGAWLGEVSCFHSFKNPSKVRLCGCIGIKQSTILTVLEELCDEIARNGFDKILIVNCHGGNIALLKHFIRCQTYTEKRYSTMSTFALDFRMMSPARLIDTVRKRKKEFSYVTEEDIKTIESYAEKGYGGGHADFRETSLILAHNENLVAVENYEKESGISTHKSDKLTNMGVDSPNAWLLNFPSSYEAYPPHGASKTIGRLMLALSAERLAKIFKTIKDDPSLIKAVYSE